ncbi:MMPL family transporter [Reichenbachiella agarivorans]|uniref:MMPL family transporter n=1 Tax=Reichenbachiella agarivorans TaxID=2979464 RepID=A0ABY6CUN5_9BACT|nr:MMPL family transporter [Reichenbachiella agarivorans]UXP33158.1 MMPL family transporter [Reichenbachiella agarivorans]
MWNLLSSLIIKFRLYLIILLLGITAFMGYKGQYVKWSFVLANVVPDHDPDMIDFKAFKESFGEDGNILALGILDSAIYKTDNFRKLGYMSDELMNINGVNDVLSLPSLKKLVKDQEAKQFKLEPVFDKIPSDQAELDSLIQYALGIKFYSGQLINPTNGANMVLVTIQKELMNSDERNRVISDILFITHAFEKDTGIKLRYAGLPYVRYINTSLLKDELRMFLILSVIVTGFILFLFFRSFKVLLVALCIIGMVVVWVIGTLVLLDYEITLLTGLLPPIIVVIGIPNTVYMINKYHQEYFAHGDQERAIRTIIRKIGIVTFITNMTTAVGFLVLALTDIVILKEFGIVAGINILATFMVSMIMIPAVFSYLKPPSKRHLKHLQFKPLDRVLTALDLLVHRYKEVVFVVTAVVCVVCVYGISKIEAVSFMVDDLPEESQTKQDLLFFEEHFAGVMPLEIVVDTKKRKGVQNLNNLRKIDQFESFLDSIDFISKPLSVVSFIKATRQAFYNDKPIYYDLPNERDKNFILRYLSKATDEGDLASAFVDSTGQKIRISLKMADIGSVKMDSLVNQVIQPRIDTIFGDKKFDIAITGTTLLFIKGNKFLIDNLVMSMVIAFVIIAFIMGLLFKNFKMIVICLIPNIIPLLITGGMMGLVGIPLKPSTALIFSIAFGISVDDSIHFLAKYRQELFANNFFVPVAVSKSIRETGASMIYTSVILFFGFVIFAASDFGGTVALGTLTSTTLLMAMLTNLTLLPALLLRFDNGKRNKQEHPLIEQYPEFYEESEDEEIDLDMIEVDPNTTKE